MSTTKHYIGFIRTLSPVHIGCEITYQNKEYIYQAQQKQYYFPDMAQLIQDVMSRDRRTQEAFVSGFQRGRGQRLEDILKKCHIQIDDWGGYRIQGSGYENTGRPDRLNEIHAFIKNAYQEPYVPGSSIKGALRNVIENTRDDANGNELFRRIRVSDSQPIDRNQLMICKRWSYDESKELLKELNLYRESLKPLTDVYFTVSAEGSDVCYFIDNFEKLVNDFNDQYYERFLYGLPQEYRQNLPGISSIYLGGGSGFWTKVRFDVAEPEYYQRRQRNRMKGNGLHKLTKAPKDSLKVKEKNIPLIQNNRGIYEMGKVYIAFKEIKSS